MLPRREMLDLIVVDGRARGVIARDLVSGALETHLGDAVVLATGGYANVYFLSTKPRRRTRRRFWRGIGRGAASRILLSAFHRLPAARGSTRPNNGCRSRAQRRAPLGADRPATKIAQDNTRGATTSRASIPALRQSRAPRRGVAAAKACATRLRIGPATCVYTPGRAIQRVGADVLGSATATVRVSSTHGRRPACVRCA